MHWVYVLQCEDNHIYVGETIRLCTRLNKHVEGSGSDNTRAWSPEKILAVYKVANNQSYYNYKYFAEEMKERKRTYLLNWKDEKYIVGKTHFETYITEWLKNHYTSVNHWNIAGGSHCKFGFRSRPNIQEPGYDRPSCHCGVPAEVNYSEKNDYIYFTCPRSGWDREAVLNRFGPLQRDQPCKFWQKYTGDKDARSKWTPPKRCIEDLRDIFEDD